MSSLYVDRRAVHLQHDAGAIAFYENGQRSATVPLAPLTRLIVRGKATLEASLLGKLGEQGVGVLVLSGKLGRPSLFLGRAHHDAARRVEQTRRSLEPPFCVDIARWLVQRKLQRQHQWFASLREHHPAQRYALTHAMGLLQQHLEPVGEAATLDRLRGLEGAAACDYFAGLRAVVPASLGFNNRNRRPPRDPFNALLSLTYTIVTAEIAMALHCAGYDPCVGYYHQLSLGRESLACDLMDPQRTLADRLCLHLVSSQAITAEHFSTDKDGCILHKAGRVRYYQAYEEHAEVLRKAIDRDVRALAEKITPHMPVPDRTQLASADDPSTWQPQDAAAPEPPHTPQQP